MLYFHCYSVQIFFFSGLEPCGILAPQSGFEPLPPIVEALSLNQWNPSSPTLKESRMALDRQSIRGRTKKEKK